MCTFVCMYTSVCVCVCVRFYAYMSARMGDIGLFRSAYRAPQHRPLALKNIDRLFKQRQDNQITLVVASARPPLPVRSVAEIGVSMWQSLIVRIDPSLDSIGQNHKALPGNAASGTSAGDLSRTSSQQAMSETNM